jgi:hypothetical protein
VPEDHFGDQVAEVYDDSSAALFAPEVLGPAVDLLAELAGDGAALEFAIGTGRVALPLAARGLASEAAVDNAFDRIRCAVPKSTGDEVESARVQVRYLQAGEETLSLLVPYGYRGVTGALVAGDALALADHTPRIGLSADKHVTRSQREDRYRPHRPAPLRSHAGLPDILGALRLVASEGVGLPSGLIVASQQV